MDSRVSYEEQVLYSHLMELVRVQHPQIAIDCIRQLFVEGTEYIIPEVQQAVDALVAADGAEIAFPNMLHRCCYILINYWKLHPHNKPEVIKLIALFAQLPATPLPSPAKQRLQKLVRQFARSEGYKALQSQFLVQPADSPQSKPLRTLVHRYPFLSEHFLSLHSTREQRQAARRDRQQKQATFEVELSKYITYRQSPKLASSARNPTLLSRERLDCALRQYVGKVDTSNTYRDLAQQFCSNSHWIRNYRDFKTELYNYLAYAADFSYCQGRGGQGLNDYLFRILDRSDDLKPNERLLEETCRKLLDFLIVDNAENLEHSVFINLTGSSDRIIPSIGILLKIVLIYKKMRSYLERKFAILFNHYRTVSRDSVEWLVATLETWNVAFSTNFGSMQLCYWG